MEGSNGITPKQNHPEESSLEKRIIEEFQKFISQREVGRPHPQILVGKIEESEKAPHGSKNSEAFTLINKMILKMDIGETDIETFSKAIDYFVEIEQGSGMHHLNIKGYVEEFAPLRRKILLFLLRKTPNSEEELHHYIRIYATLNIAEPSKISALWRKRKGNVYHEVSYVESLRPAEAVAYIKKRVRGLSPDK
jgi:hypothetical protein